MGSAFYLVGETALYTCSGNLQLLGMDTNTCADDTLTWNLPPSSNDFPICGKFLLVKVGNSVWLCYFNIENKCLSREHKCQKKQFRVICCDVIVCSYKHYNLLFFISM